MLESCGGGVDRHWTWTECRLTTQAMVKMTSSTCAPLSSQNTPSRIVGEMGRCEGRIVFTSENPCDGEDGGGQSILLSLMDRNSG
jgi:hypothetical protein